MNVEEEDTMVMVAFGGNHNAPKDVKEVDKWSKAFVEIFDGLVANLDPHGKKHEKTHGKFHGFGLTNSYKGGQMCHLQNW